MGKGRLISGALVLAIALGACGSDRTQRAVGIAGIAPRTLDFGRVGLGATVTREIRLDNHGRAPLHLRRWEVPGEGKDIFPVLRGNERLGEGEKAVLVVRFTPDAEGPLDRIMTIETDDPSRPLIEVQLLGEGVRPQVDVEPELLDFGRVELGFEERLPVLLSNPFDIPVEVRIGTRGDDQFTPSVVDVVQVEPESTLTVEVAYLPQRVGEAWALLALLPCPTCDEALVALQGTGIDRALVVVPPELDFGYVPTERSAERSFTVTNVSSRPVEIHSMEQTAGLATFQYEPVVGMLQPGESLSVSVTFSPTRTEPDEDAIEIVSSSMRSPTTYVRLRGAGGGPQIQLSPRELAFGMAPIGSRPQIDLIVTNAGTTPAAPPLEILDIRVENPTTAPFGPDRDLIADPVVLFAGEQARVPIGYEPTRLSDVDDVAELVVVSNDAAQPEIRIPLSGRAFVAPPCDNLLIRPGRLDFGQLDEGAGAVLSFTIENPGPQVCIMRNLRIAPGSDPVFRTREVTSFLVPAGGFFGWMVDFDPRRVGAGSGAWRGEVELFAVNAIPQRYSVPLSARSGDGCLVPTPNFLDFGTEQDGCGSRTGRVRFTNRCEGPIPVEEIAIGEQSSEDEFELLSAPGAPFSLAPGAGFDVDVRWNTSRRGINSAPLYVREGGRVDPLMVPLIGELLRDGRVEDRFLVTRDDAVDLLVVIDNSNSMVEEPPRLRASLPILFDEGMSRGIDFRIAVTTTGLAPSDVTGCPGGVQGGEAGRFFPVDGSRPRILTPSTPAGASVLADNSQVGNCHELEQGLEAARLALSEPLRSGENAGFLRNDASLALVFVSDEDDHSGFAVDDYLDFLVALKGRGGFVASSLVDVDGSCPSSAGIGERFTELAQASGGVSASICGDWDAAMRRIADASYTARSTFPLSERPADPSSLVVMVGATELPSSDWRYDDGTNSVSFVPGRAPPPGTRIRVLFETACR